MQTVTVAAERAAETRAIQIITFMWQVFMEPETFIMMMGFSAQIHARK